MIRASRASVPVLIAVMLSGGWATAQTGDADVRPTAPGAADAPPLSGPLRLTPIPSEPARSDAAGKPQPERPSPPRETRRSIEVESLSAIDPNSIGTLGVGEGGFSTGMWNDTPRPVIERLVADLPLTIRSPVIRDLARRLLLSAAALPSWPDDGTKRPPLQLIRTRVSHLQAMGDFKDARRLLSITPGRRTDPELLRLEAEDRLYANDYGGACQIVRGAGEHLSKPYWQRLLAFCQALQGDIAGATFGAGLLSESGENGDPAFFALIDRITNTSQAPIESLQQPSPLHLAMLRTAKIKVPKDTTTTDTPAILFSVGVSPNADLETRLTAAEKATELGAMSHARLAEIYMGLKFDRNELNNALSLASADRTARGRALLFQAAQAEAVTMARAAVISKAFEIAHEEGRFLHAIRLYRPLLADLPPASEMAWFAPEAVRALYALDRPVPARAWIEELQLAAARGEEYRTLLDGLWFLGMLTDSGTSRDNFAKSLAAWANYHRKKSGDRAREKIAAGLLLLGALGHEAPPEAWWGLLKNPERPRGAVKVADPALRAAMRRAAAEGRMGEAVALALLILGERSPGIDDIGAVADTAASLRRIGLENEARLLVVETAAVAGL